MIDRTQGWPLVAHLLLQCGLSLRGCEEIDLSDIAGNPSPRPSPRGRGRARGVTCQCIFFVEWEIHVKFRALDRPLPPGEGWGEGPPATSVSSISSPFTSQPSCRFTVHSSPLTLCSSPF